MLQYIFVFLFIIVFAPLIYYEYKSMDINYKKRKEFKINNVNVFPELEENNKPFKGLVIGGFLSLIIWSIIIYFIIINN